jgi:GH43 family beta-xylosidase
MLTRTFHFLLATFLSVSLQGQFSGKQLEEIRIRDPFIMSEPESRSYYMYASLSGGGEVGHKGVQVYKSNDLLVWEGPVPVFIIPEGFWAEEMVWAPEVHKYNGRYYLFVTLTSDRKLKQIDGRPEIVKRASQIFVSDSPEGPFEPFANKPHTPSEWMSLDATLWVEDGQPYMIFCHEWIQTTDGTMEVVKLKKDLSATIGKPKTIFSARQAGWVRSLGSVGSLYRGEAYEGYVTDGPFLFRTSAGKLMMIWSSFGEEKYAIGLAESISGKVSGPWKIVPEPLYRANGGHGMIFRDFDGRLLLVFHQPNDSPDERAKLFELEDTGSTIKLKGEL